MDSAIVAALKEYREKPEFKNGGGYQVLRHYLKRDYGYIVNPKKIYRLMKENGLLLARRKKFRRDDKKISSNRKINGPGELWQFDIKYGFVHGENKFFYLGAFIDVFTKEVVGYHVGTSCKGIHLALAFDEAVRLHRPDLSKLTIRSDNGPQMSSNKFKTWINKRVVHEFIPAGEPNKNAYIEAFFSIYEIEFLQVRYFENFSSAYKQTVEFISHYNSKRLHGSINFLPPIEFKQRHLAGKFSQNIIQA